LIYSCLYSHSLLCLYTYSIAECTYWLNERDYEPIFSDLLNNLLSSFADDEPDDGPQHYVFVSGFRTPQLLPLLSELGIHVNGVIKLESESYDVLKNRQEKRRAAEPPDGQFSGYC